MAAYYSEIDPYAAQWLRNLIAAGHIADGVVDSRSIIDVKPDDLKEFTQCHFFAGIGVWSRALRMAQWPDTRRVWTGSCPCQPFSVAGAGSGVHDERHLWPHWHWLIEQCQPEIVLGEQVEAAIRHGWLDLVQSDMEGIGYAFAAAGVPAAGVGAPHIRQRLWFVAHANKEQRGRWPDSQLLAHGAAAGWQQGHSVLESNIEVVGLGLADSEPTGRLARGACGAQIEVDGAHPRDDHGSGDASGSVGRVDHHHHHQGLEGFGGGHQAPSGRQGAIRPAAEAGEPDGLAHAHQDGCESRGAVRPVCQEHDAEHGGAVGGMADDQQIGHHGCGVTGAAASAERGRVAASGHGDAIAAEHTGPTNGHWRDADWLLCRDGKWRPVSPLPQPLVDGSSESLGRVRPEVITQIEKEINAATAQTQGGRAAAMRALLEALGAEAKRCWPSGGFPGLHEAPFLLAFLRQLQEQGWHIAQGVSLPCPQTTDGNLRGLRDIEAAGSAPCERSLDGQPPGEPANAVCVLSCLLARRASEAWGDAYAAHAETGFPLTHNARSRVGRLRAYGNAVVAQVAQTFIESVMEALP